MTKSTKWFLGILAVLSMFVVGVVILLVTVFPLRPGTMETVTTGSGEKLAVIELRGVITGSDDVVRQLKKYRENSSIRGILLRVDSPGGAVVPSQEMYEAVRKTRDSGKPIVVSMGSLAASGGYYVACGASRIVANNGTLTGSIGVIAEFLQVQEALQKLGIDVKIVKSGTLKDAGVPTRSMTEDERQYFQDLMDTVHRQFIEVVERERNLSHDDVLNLADGRVFIGQQAVDLGLVDTLGTYEDAVRIAADLAGITGEPALVRERKSVPWWAPGLEDVTDTMNKLKTEILERPVLSFRFVGPY
ncbi:MAG: signal peptide peptidase SppA [Ignavibacteria bacterium]|nr:signal peptide peptidase SppA [Ignavibacteria bacterium]